MDVGADVDVVIEASMIVGKRAREEGSLNRSSESKRFHLRARFPRRND